MSGIAIVLGKPSRRKDAMKDMKYKDDMEDDMDEEMDDMDEGSMKEVASTVAEEIADAIEAKGGVDRSALKSALLNYWKAIQEY